jgi:hypothetical protein
MPDAPIRGVSARDYSTRYGRACFTCEKGGKAPCASCSRFAPAPAFNPRHYEVQGDSVQDALRVRAFLLHHAGKPVSQYQIGKHLGMSRSKVCNAITRLTYLDSNVSEEDNGAILYVG